MKTPNRSNESGIAMIIALFMMLALSVIGATLMAVSTTETNSSFNYRQMSQARYGAESAVHKSINYLLNTYPAPSTQADLALYDLTVSPVRLKANNQVVVLSTVVAQSNYPDAAVKTAYAAAAQGPLAMKDATVQYAATATLKSMRQITDPFSNQPVTIQTWSITGDGTITGGRSAQVEVESVLERQIFPIFAYAAFATKNGCNALSFKGGATTDSYDSTELVNGKAQFGDYFGNVGTNGGLDASGAPTKIWGTLSTPRSGVGNCSAGNVTAATFGGDTALQEDINKLSQPLNYPTPEPPDQTPPETSFSFKKDGCATGTAYCTPGTAGVVDSFGNTYATITPPSPTSEVVLGDVDINAGADLHLNAGTYIVNSFTLNGNANLVIDSGPVIIKIVGADQSIPLKLNGNGLSNPGLDPSNLRFVYGGTAEVDLNGGAAAAALVYAPNATSKFTGNGDFYGAIVTNTLTDGGGAAIHYDRHLQTEAMQAGNFQLSAFTWKVAQ